MGLNNYVLGTKGQMHIERKNNMRDIWDYWLFGEKNNYKLKYEHTICKDERKTIIYMHKIKSISDRLSQSVYKHFLAVYGTQYYENKTYFSSTYETGRDYFWYNIH